MMARLFSILLSVLAPTCFGAEKLLDFGQYKLNETPTGFRSTVTGQGKPGDWKIVLDDAPSAIGGLSQDGHVASKRSVLAQLARDKTDEHFPLLIYETETFGDFALSTEFKVVDGQEEQMAGVAFRVQDENNYYYVRASVLGRSFVFYKVVNGERSKPIPAQMDIAKGVWHKLQIQCIGTKINISLNGKPVWPQMEDNTFSSGKIGFWTKSDSVAYFGETRLNYTPKQIYAQTLVNEALKQYPRLRGLKMYAAPPGKTNVQVIASGDKDDIGSIGKEWEQDVIGRSIVYYGKDKDKGLVIVTMPLHDHNGEAVAAVKVYMKSFPGQTEKNALVRALPVVKNMESRVQTLTDLIQ